jgi:hypothetical protein
MSIFVKGGIVFIISDLKKDVFKFKNKLRELEIIYPENEKVLLQITRIDTKLNRILFNLSKISDTTGDK